MAIAGSANDSSGYSSGSSRISGRRSNSLDVNNIDQVPQNQPAPPQNNAQFFEAYDCTRCGNIHRKGTVCNAVTPPTVLQQPSPISRPQSRDSYSSHSSGLNNSGPLPALRSDEAEDHEMQPSCQSEPLNLATFGLKETPRPPSRTTLRGGNSVTVDPNVQINAKARLPAKIRLKSQLIQGSTSASQVCCITTR